MRGRAICRGSLGLTPPPEPHDVRSLSLTYYGGHSVAPHRHEWGQLLFARSGLMRVIAGGSVWSVPPTRAIWIPPGIEHQFRTQGDVAFRTLYLAPARCPEIGRGLDAIEVAPLLRELILQICAIQMLEAGDAFHRGLSAVLIGLIDCAQSLDLALPFPADPRARRLAEHFQAQPEDRATLAELAAMAGGSVRTLQRCFTAETGMTIEAWRQKARLIASTLALDAGSSVTHAALDCGYDSTSAYIAAFKRQFGMTPRRFARSG